MTLPLNILLVEDNPDDEHLISRSLIRGGLSFQATRVETRDQFCQNLDQDRWDVVIADYCLPGFSGLEALAILKEQRSIVPFILVSGTVGEEVAVQSIQAGADDYLLKQNLIRLVPAVTRAIRESGERRKREAAERALQESRERLELIHNSVSDFLVFLTGTPDGRWCYTSVNPAFLAKLQSDGQETSAEQLLGRDAEEVEANVFRLDVETADWFADLRRRAIAAGIPITSERELRLPAGAFVCELTFIPVLDSIGQCRHLLIDGRDVTVQRRAEERDGQLRDQIIQTHRLESLGTLAGGIAHDFNNLLTGIFGFADLARAANELQEAQSQCDQIILVANRARELVGRILTFSRRQPSIRQPVSLSDLVRELVPLMRASFPRTVEFDVQLPDGGPRVHADAGQLHQVLLNLGTNAIHAMPLGGRLTIAVEEVELIDPVQVILSAAISGVHAKLTVSDSGMGMDGETLRRAFEPFFTTKPVGEGTGLGLSVVHGIIQDHGGAIQVTSEINQGTTFEVYLPVFDNNQVSTLSTGSASATDLVPVAQGERVLSVDDDPNLAKLTAQILFGLGYRPTTFIDPVEAFGEFKADPNAFAAVLTDNRMPTWSGVEFAQKVSQVRADIPIILVTGAIEPADLASFQTLPNGLFLAKPYSREQLAFALKKSIDRVANRPTHGSDRPKVLVNAESVTHDHRSRDDATSTTAAPRNRDHLDPTHAAIPTATLSPTVNNPSLSQDSFKSSSSSFDHPSLGSEDVTFLKQQLAKEIDQHARTREALRSSMEDLSFARGIAHDVNNELLVIYFSSKQLLSQLPEQDSHRDTLMAISDARARAVEFMRQFLARKPAN